MDSRPLKLIVGKCRDFKGYYNHTTRTREIKQHSEGILIKQTNAMACIYFPKYDDTDIVSESSFDVYYNIIPFYFGQIWRSLK